MSICRWVAREAAKTGAIDDVTEHVVDLAKLVFDFVFFCCLVGFFWTKSFASTEDVKGLFEGARRVCFLAKEGDALVSLGTIDGIVGEKGPVVTDIFA